MTKLNKRRGNRKRMEAPVTINVILEANSIVQLDRQAIALTKKHGFTISRGELIREIITNYLDVSGV